VRKAPDGQSAYRAELRTRGLAGRASQSDQSDQITNKLEYRRVRDGQEF